MGNSSAHPTIGEFAAQNKPFGAAHDRLQRLLRQLHSKRAWDTPDSTWRFALEIPAHARFLSKLQLCSDRTSLHEYHGMIMKGIDRLSTTRSGNLRWKELIEAMRDIHNTIVGTFVNPSTMEQVMAALSRSRLSRNRRSSHKTRKPRAGMRSRRTHNRARRRICRD